MKPGSRPAARMLHKRCLLGRMCAVALLVGCSSQPVARDYWDNPAAAVEAIVKIGKEVEELRAQISREVCTYEERAKPLVADGESARLRGDWVAYSAYLRGLVALKAELATSMDARLTMIRRGLGGIADIAASTRLRESQRAVVLSVLKPGNDVVRMTDVAIQRLREEQAHILRHAEELNE